MLGHLVGDGYQVVGRAEDAQLIVVNTCGFIDAAKEESIDAILEMARYKQEGKAERLVVAGCLSQRYADDLAREIPEVDHFLGTGNFEAIVDVLHGRPQRSRQGLPVLGDNPSPAIDASAAAEVVASTLPVRSVRRVPDGVRPTSLARRARSSPPKTEGRSQPRVTLPDPDFTLSSASPRVATLPGHFAYVKVSEGCSNRCAFCIIPQLRGPQRSRPVGDVVIEVERLLAGGCVEINLLAQNLCAYGLDREPKETLAQLLRALDGLGGRGSGAQPYWIRCLYAYPRGLTREVIDVLGSAAHVVKYLDMPLQHIADPILRRMRRGTGGEATLGLVRRLRAVIPGLVLRTTFITGLPGETEDDFAQLCDFVREIRFERMGVFTYSREEGTPAADMDGQVPAELAAQRRDTLMALQRDISQEQQQALVGQSIEVLVEGVSDESDLLLQGRHQGQAPEIDGLTYITSGTARVGEVARVRVAEAGEYDLAGEIIDTPELA
jgi:ribosomal protein S12 methylthiotransferase